MQILVKCPALSWMGCRLEEEKKNQTHAISSNSKVWIYRKVGYGPVWSQKELTGLQLGRVIRAE